MSETRIRSLLDDDLYKFSMQSAVLGAYPEWEMRASFTNRGCTPFPSGFGERLHREIETWRELAVSAEEIDWLRRAEGLEWISEEYLVYLADYRFDPSEVTISQEGTELRVSIEGPWHRAIRWEVPLLATISELFYEMTGRDADRGLLAERFGEKAEIWGRHGCRVVEFGTRRRASASVHDEVVRLAAEVPDVFAGTSNLHLARKHGLRPVGTHAHEWFMAHQAIFGAADANRLGLLAWLDAHGGKLATALTDTYTTESFLCDFDSALARRYDGVRQDSGDPFEWGRRLASHFESLGIDPTSRTAVFSDSLDTGTPVRLQDEFGHRFQVVFGIGTHLTNDCGLEPLNIVIKASAFRLDGGSEWRDAVKLSDVAGKHHGTAEAVAVVRHDLAEARGGRTDTDRGTNERRSS